MADNPGIKIEALGFGSNTDFNNRITILQASNTLPDLGYFDGSTVLAWGMNGQLVDLTELYKSPPAKLDSLRFVTPNGRIVGVSVANDAQVLWYNRKMFDAAGLAYPPAKASKAWSWDRFVQVARQLTKDADGKTPDDPDFAPQSTRSFGAWVRNGPMPWITFAVSNGGGFVSQDGTKLLLDDPATMEAIQKIADLANVHHVSPKNNGTPDDRSAKRIGMVAMIDYAITFWNQAGSMLNWSFNQGGCNPEKGKKVVREWIDTNRKGCETFKDAVNLGYSNLEKFFERA